MAKAKKSARKSARKASGRTTKAIVVVEKGPAPKRRRPAARPSPAKRRRHRRSSSSGGGGGVIGAIKREGPGYAMSSAYGYVTNATTGMAATVKGYLDKVPTITAIGAPATHGLLSHFIAGRTSGTVRRVFDLLANSAMHRAAYNLGAKGFDLSAAALTAGVDDDGGKSGSIGYDEAAGYPDDGY